MRLRPALGVLGALLLVAGLGLFVRSTPLDDLRSPLLLGGLLLLGLALAAGSLRVQVTAPRALLLASLLASVGAVAADGVEFLRQVRTQAGMTSVQRRDAALEETVGLRGAELAEAQRILPEDAAVLVLLNSSRNLYAAQLADYYLRPRRLYYWRDGPQFQLVDGRAAALPDRAWLEARGIRWALLLEGNLGNRLRALPLEEVPLL